MKYHLMASLKATPRNWRKMLHAFAARPHRKSEPYVRAIRDAARSAQIAHNQRSEFLVFLDSLWTPEYGIWHDCHNPVFESHEPHHIQLTRTMWGVTVTLSYHNITGGRGESSEKILLDIKGSDPEDVRKFGHEAVRTLGQAWAGSLFIGFSSGGSRTVPCGSMMSVDKAVDAMIQEAPDVLRQAAALSA